MEDNLISKQEMLAALDDLAHPIDFEDLEKRGLLKRKGNSAWFQILKPDELPRHVKMQATEVMRTSGSPDEWKFKTATASRLKEIRSIKNDILGQR